MQSFGDKLVGTVNRWIYGNKKSSSSAAGSSGSGQIPFSFGPRAAVDTRNKEINSVLAGPEVGPFVDPTNPKSPPVGKRSNGSGYSAPEFDTTPFETAANRVNLQTDAAKKLITQMQAQLAAGLQQRAADYQAAAQKLQDDLKSYGQQAQQQDMSAHNAVQQDLAQQGVAGQGVAAQAQVQQQAQQQALARQQDYLARLAQIAAQNQSDRRAASDQMFAGLNSQAELQRTAQIGAIEAEQVKALQAFQNALRGRSLGGGGRRGGGGGGSDSLDPTESQIWGLNNRFEFNQDNPDNRYQQTADIGMTPYARGIAELAFTAGPGTARAQWLADQRAYNSGTKGVFGPNWSSSAQEYAQNVDKVLDTADRYYGGSNYFVTPPTRQSVLQSYSQLVGAGGNGPTPLRRNPKR